MKGAKALLGLALFFPQAGAETGWRERLDKAYARAGLAAEVMYIDGLLANRHPEYQLFSRENQRMDLSLERQRFVELFAGGLRVRFETQILQLKTLPDGSAEVLLDEVMAVEHSDESGGTFYTDQVLWRLVDHWEMWHHQPRIRRSRLYWQLYAKGPRLMENISLWKNFPGLPQPATLSPQQRAGWLHRWRSAKKFLRTLLPP